MKQSDIITVVIIAVVGTLAAYFGVNMFLGNPADASFQFKTIGVVSKDLAEPDPEVFNRDAINPTIEVYVGECEDLDQNGEIDKAELVNCGQYSGTNRTVETETEGEEGGNGESENEEDEAPLAIPSAEEMPDEGEGE